MRGLAGNLSDLNMASSHYDILLCSETLVSDMRQERSSRFPDSVALSCCAVARCLGPEGWLRTCEMVTEHIVNANKFECGFCEMAVFGVCGVVVVVVVVGQTVGSISSKTMAYDCLYTLELCTASMIATS